jgi:hypothetical protein
VTIDRKARQSEVVRWHQRQAQVAELVKHWHDTHSDRWEPWPEIVQIEIKAAVAQLAHDAVDRQGNAGRMAPFGKPRFDKLMRSLVSQLRVKRFGPLLQFTAEQLHEQHTIIADELGWSWIDATPRPLPISKPTSDAKAAA